MWEGNIKSSDTKFKDVGLLFNFMRLATGALYIEGDAVQYTGIILNRDTSLVIPIENITNVSVKTVDETFLVLLTVQETSFIQLSLNSGI